MKGRLNWTLVLGIALSTGFLYAAFREVDINGLTSALAGANYLYLIPVLALTFVGLWFRAVRWYYLMLPIKKIGVSRLFAAMMIGLALNNLLPVRLGEFARAYCIDARENVGKTAAFTTLVVERILDGMTVLLFFGFLVLRQQVALPSWLRSAALAALGFFLLVLVLLVLLKLQAEWVRKAASFIMKPAPTPLSSAVLGIINGAVSGLQVFHSAGSLVLAAVLSLFVWVPAGLIIFCLLLGFGVHLPISASFLVLVILCIGLMIPSAPGSVGTFQFFCVAGLSLFAVDRHVAASFSILFHATQFVPATAIGLVCMLAQGGSISEIKHSAELEQSTA